MGNCLTGVVLYVHKGKGNRNKTEKETGDLLREILGPWIPPGGKKNKKKSPTQICSCEGNFGFLDPTRRKKKKKKRVPPRSVAMKEKERNEKNIYIFKKKKNQKIRINMKP